ncbi:TIGR00725 family protein [Methanohalobium sp.]|uniref:TIGR00725 family protein n=1 Tax=Methanohalobium sp. TaxID=2837493 RepID=UPI0025F0469F|nr:TIGR00725 family protein [Methanohalobium sp.]
MNRAQIGVIGAGDCDARTLELAENVGKCIARRDGILICGALGGVMEAASKGAKEENGTTLGILPGKKRDESNPYIDIAVVSDLGEARNALIARSSDVLIAVSGGYGTLSEIAMSLKMGKNVVVLESYWDIEGTYRVDNPEEAVDMAFGFL